MVRNKEEREWESSLAQLFRAYSIFRRLVDLTDPTGFVFTGNTQYGRLQRFHRVVQRVLQEALKSLQDSRTFQLERFEGTKGVAYVIDPKAMTKEALYAFAGTPNLSSQDRFTQDTQPHYVNSPHWIARRHRVNLAELRDYVKARLKVFYEEELDVPLVLFNEVLEHVQRIDFIFRQPQGHLLLIGVPGAGNTMRSRFVD
ncbi:dynein heavy chain [Culex quinquefasciatus]|uniref:Dynein heavy chain n=1 Tax=Culex quinquefasciatus TaxID=7176 RepID=B0X555_CULQU|nr:dynein heavy chain [Culex quinquefasciatus]|eukprot:XP_001864777.1 dynein heavy chain [Culex quinquefasciatus]